MRILIYWEQESWGGVDTHLLELLSTWPVLEDEIVLMVNQGNAGFIRLRTDFEALPQVRCVVVPSYSHNELNRRFRRLPLLRGLSTLLHFFQPITFWLTVRQMRRHFSREGRFDLLLSNNGGYPAAWGTLCALEASSLCGISSRLLLVHHAATSAGPFMGWFEQLVDRKVSRLTTAVVCVSRATRNSLLTRRWLDDEALRIRVIHHGISLGQPQTDGTGISLRAAVAAKPGERLVGIVGRVDAYKGHEDLIFALARLTREAQMRLRLVIIGSGTAAELARLRLVADNLGIGERVHLLGYLPGRPIDIIAQLDLLAMVTRSFEGFGLTLAEAMVVGVPVLATRVGAIPEFVDESCGMLVNPGAPDEIAEALLDWLKTPETWLRRADVARERAVQADGAMAREYRRLFVECLASDKDISRERLM